MGVVVTTGGVTVGGVTVGGVTTEGVNTLGGSYFYWAALPGAPSLPDDVRSIYVYKFSDQTDAQWRAAVADVLAAIAAQEA